MANKDTIYKVYDGVAKWAKLFPHNMDKGEGDNDAARTIKKLGGQYSIDLLVDQATMDKMIADGIPKVSLGYAQFKEDAETGLWVYKGKRTHLSKNLKDGSGKPVVQGPPNVVDWAKTSNNIKPDTWDENVLIGNGSKVKVKFSIYKNESKRIIRLESVAVVELVEYKADGEQGVRW